jgi:hypothetical protein
VREAAAMTRARVFVLLTVIALGAALEAQTGQPGSTTMAIVGGTLIDGTGAAPRPDVTILVSGARIEAIGPAASTPVPPGARVIRANGKFVLPGFIDAHVHYRDYYPELLITYGITSVADWGGSPIEWVLAQKEGVDKGKIYGPRIYTSGEVIGETRSDAATVDAAVKQVRDLAARGVDRIDVGYDVSPELVKAIVQEAHRLGLSVSGYPLRAREAIEAGLDAFKHTHTLGRANTDAAGIAILTKDLGINERFRNVHPCVLDGNADSLMQLMLSHKTIWIPTLVKDFKAVLPRRDEFERDNINLIGNPDLGYLPIQDLLLQLSNASDEGLMQTPCGNIGTYEKSSPDYALFQRSYTQLLRFIGTFVKSGGRVLAGTAPHSFVLPGISLHHEMQLFVDAGLTPAQALQSASLWPAEWMRAQKDIGSVEAGKLADLVVLTKNPLDDIRNTRTVETVIQGGRVLPTGYHRSYTNPIPRNTQRSAPSGGYARPELSKIAPLVVTEGSGDVSLRVTGRQFAKKSVVLFESVPIPTEFVSETELKAVLPSRLLQTAGTYWLHVFTQRPGGGESTPASIIVKFK